MIIDINTYCGHWPFRDLRDGTLSALDALGRQSGITHMLVSSLDGVFYKDVHQANRQLYTDMQSYQGAVKFVPLAFVNPGYVCWEHDMREAIESFGFCGIELTPKYRGYLLNLPAACTAAKIAASYHIPVRLNAGFENFRQRHHMDTYENAFTAAELLAFISNAPDTTFLITGLSPLY